MLTPSGPQRHPMTSYAQNFEDVILDRAFGRRRDGFYIDVGAGDPVIDSVSCWFREIGWRGINIEPVPDVFDRLARTRPDDVNLRCAVGRRTGIAAFHIVDGTGLSSLDPSCLALALRHEFTARTVTIEIRTLADICRQYVTRPIDFLKIDVEGAEHDVIAGADWQAYRPKIVVVEATHPLSQEPSHHKWEPDLLRSDYVFAWFDGLNRFYVAREHQDLVPVIAAPPNVFDEFRRFAELPSINSAVAQWRDRAMAAEAELRVLRARVADGLKWPVDPA